MPAGMQESLGTAVLAPDCAGDEDVVVLAPDCAGDEDVCVPDDAGDACAGAPGCAGGSGFL